MRDMVFVEDFIQYLRYEKNYSTHTVVAYKHDLYQLMEFAERECRVNDPAEIDSDIIRSWMVEMMTQGMSARSVNRKLSSLKSFWHYLKRRGLVSSNPVQKVIAPKVRKVLPVFLKENEMEALLESVAEDVPEFVEQRDRLILDLLYSTGMRLSELIGLTDEAVDLDGCSLRVTGKRNKQRIIPFGLELRDSINQYIRSRTDILPGVSVRLLVRENGLPLYPQLVYRIVHARLTEVGTLTKNSPHVLRHTFATTLLNRGAELNAVKELLGHSSLSATEVYTHTTFAELNRVYKLAHPRA
jgi:integrase/recombinase XerC